MTSIYAPVGKVLGSITISNEQNERVLLPDIMKGSTTLLFLATKASHAKLFETVYEFWKGAFGINDRRYRVCYVSLLRDTHGLTVPAIEAARQRVYNVMRDNEEMREEQKDNGKNDSANNISETLEFSREPNIMNSICLTTIPQMSTWMRNMEIPLAFLDVDNDNYEEEMDAAKDTLEFPIIMLLSPDGIIRRCILGLQAKKLDIQRQTILELIQDAKPPVSTAHKMDAPPVSSKENAVGIGTYNFFGTY